MANDSQGSSASTSPAINVRCLPLPLAFFVDPGAQTQVPVLVMCALDKRSDLTSPLLTVEDFNGFIKDPMS